MPEHESVPSLDNGKTCPLCRSDDIERVGDKNKYTIASCNSCGLRFVEDMPTTAELEIFYTKNYGSEKDKANMARKVYRWYRKLLPLKFFARGKLFLDLGCNTGFAVEAARLLGFRSTGYDLSAKALGLAREKFVKCDFYHGTAIDAASVGERYDAVVCAEMVEHLTELEAFGQALEFLVKPGGVLYLTTPDLGRFRNNQKFLGQADVCPPEHLIYFGREQIKRFLQKAGFKILLFSPVFNKPSIRVFARKMQ